MHVSSFPSWEKKCLAFTLAEVLITLGIIGIVAALTIPSLTVKYQKEQSVIKVKRIYSTLNNVMTRVVADFGENISLEDAYHMGAENYFKTYWKPYLRIAKECNSSNLCGYKSLTPWQNINGEINSTGLFYDQYGNYLMETGEYICIRSRAGNNEVNGQIIVDINGSSEPNQFGKDVFVLERTSNIILGSGHEFDNDELNTQCNEAGVSCAEKIIRDGWIIKDDYPW